MKKNIKIIISIPIHEAAEVACNQADNIKKYVPNALIVFHICKSYGNNEEIALLRQKENVVINPIRLETAWGDIIETHISNFLYAKDHYVFQYFLMHSSNDMYVRSGIEEYIFRYKAGFNFREIENKNSYWIVAHAAREDMLLNRIANGGIKYASQIEGSFYSFDIMDEIVTVLQKHMPFKKSKKPYTREELLFSTVAAKLLEQGQVGRPTTFSEVHRFDRIYQNYCINKEKILGQKDGLVCIDDIFRRCLFRSKIYRITKKDIYRIKDKDVEYIQKNGCIDDGNGINYLYDGANVFSVKRVPRNLKNRLRRFINQVDEGGSN